MANRNKDKDLNDFLNALDAVKECLSCVACAELCRNPVTLSKCFHLICSEHFDGLTRCPKCDVSLDDCTAWSDDKMNGAVDAAMNLAEMFAPLREEKTRDAESDSDETMLGLGSKPASPGAAQSAAALKSASTAKVSKGPAVKNLNTSLTSLASNASKTSNMYEKRNKKGETMLHIACRMGMLDNLTVMLQENTNVNTKDNAGWTPLHEVVHNNRLDLVRLLLGHNALVNVPGPGNETALHEAVRFNHVDIVKELVKHGGDINARNCKGETPLSLASTEMKAILKNVVSKRVITEESIDFAYIGKQVERDATDMKVYCTSQYRTVHNKLKALTKHHSNLHIETKFTNKTTHLIVDADEGICVSSLEVLQGIVNGLWILGSSWTTSSTEKFLVPFKEHEVKGVGTTTYNGPIQSRINRYLQKPGIFDGCHFYLHNFNTKYKISDKIEVTKASLGKLITDASGVVLRRVPNPESIPEAEKLAPYHAKRDGKLVNCSHYIIYKELFEPLYNMQHLKALPIGWLIECIERYQLCEPW